MICWDVSRLSWFRRYVEFLSPGISLELRRLFPCMSGAGFCASSSFPLGCTLGRAGTGWEEIAAVLRSFILAFVVAGVVFADILVGFGIDLAGFWLKRFLNVDFSLFPKVEAHARDWALATRAFSICSTNVSSATFYEGARRERPKDV